jgi:hypothetical protein
MFLPFRARLDAKSYALFRYEVEREARNANAEQRRELRQAKSRPILEDIKNYGSLAQFVGKRAVEKDAPRKSPKAGLSHSAWKSRKSRAISTFPTAPATTNHFRFPT